MKLRFNIPAFLGLMAVMVVTPGTAQETSGEAAGQLMEMLEFIGEFTMADGRWLAPEDLLDEGAGSEAGDSRGSSSPDESAVETLEKAVAGEEDSRTASSSL